MIPNRNGLAGSFRFQQVRERRKPLLHWAAAQSETKWPVFPMSLGKRRAQPPGIHLRPGRTRTISGLAVAALVDRASGIAWGSLESEAPGQPLGRRAQFVTGSVVNHGSQEVNPFLALIVKNIARPRMALRPENARLLKSAPNLQLTVGAAGSQLIARPPDQLYVWLDPREARHHRRRAGREIVRSRK